uniref:Polyamine-modulated factor 1 n=3 Tax=Noccaea caerulescens TaxID=107243 RepID=A0A1J3EMU3_NOCCA
MEKSGHETGIPGCRQSDLRKSFKSAVRSLLSACSKQDFLDIFSKFSGAEQKLLYRLYTQVIVNLHQTLEDEFDAQCQEFQVGPILDKVEQLVEEQSLDPLFSDKTNVMDIAYDLTIAKKSEIQKLTGLLQRAEEQNRQMEARISLLRRQPQHEVSGTANAIEKLKTGISVYFEGNDKLPQI